MQYVLDNTGIPVGFGVSLFLAFTVGMAITAQTFLQFSLQNEKYLAALKAMGLTVTRLVLILFLQGTIMVSLSFGIGGGLASLIGIIAGSAGSLPFYMPWQLVAISFACILTLGIASTTFSAIKVLKLEPATVFRS